MAAALLFTPLGGLVAQAATSIVSYAGMAIASIWDKDVKNDMDAIGWNPFNSNVSAVNASSKVSFYKGAPVFRTNMDRSGSFCAIFLKRTGSPTALPHTELQHEYGHNIQQMLMGPVKYGMMIFLPSAAEWSTRAYYARPWEVTADVFDGAYSKPYTQADINRGYWYLAVSTLFGPLGYLFLFGEY